MANPELELISNIVKNNDFSKVRKHGITTEFFRTEEGSVVFKWLWDYFHDPVTRGEIPDSSLLLRKYPDFDFCPSRNSIDALIRELKDTHLSSETERVLEEMLGLMDDGEDTDLILQAFFPKMRELMFKKGENNGLMMRDAYAMLKQEYDTTKDADGITGIPFPWEPLNKATGGMHSEQFIVVYGRPKNMKTWVAIDIAVFAYLCNYRVYVFSKEMRREDLARRSASILAEVDYADVKGAELSDAEEEAYFDMLESLSIWEDEYDERHDTRQPGLCFDSDKGRREASSVEDVMLRAEKYEPDLVIIDGFYLMRDGRTKSRTIDWKNIGHISQDLKNMAQYLEVPVLGTTQANRANAKNPTDDLDDLSFADNIGQDADLAMRVFKGANPTGLTKYAIALTFPGVREADLKPFLITASPGGDFSLLKKNFDLGAFLDSKKSLDAEEDGKKGESTKDPDGHAAAARLGKAKRGKRGGRGRKGKKKATKPTAKLRGNLRA